MRGIEIIIPPLLLDFLQGNYRSEMDVLQGNGYDGWDTAIVPLSTRKSWHF
jgi:hypothetical protein